MPTPRLLFYSAKNHSAKLNPSNTFLKVSKNAVYMTTGKCFIVIQNLLCFFMATTISCAVKLLGYPAEQLAKKPPEALILPPGLKQWVQTVSTTKSSAAANPTERAELLK